MVNKLGLDDTIICVLCLHKYLQMIGFRNFQLSHQLESIIILHFWNLGHAQYLPQSHYPTSECRQFSISNSHIYLIKGKFDCNPKSLNHGSDCLELTTRFGLECATLPYEVPISYRILIRLTSLVFNSHLITNFITNLR